MRPGFEDYERDTLVVRMKKVLLTLWAVLFPPLEGEDLESDDEIMVQPTVRNILDRQDSIPMESEDS